MECSASQGLIQVVQKKTVIYSQLSGWLSLILLIATNMLIFFTSPMIF